MYTLIINIVGGETVFRGRFSTLEAAQAKVTTVGPWHDTAGPPPSQGQAQFAAVYNDEGSVVAWCRIHDSAIVSVNEVPPKPR